MPKPKTNTNNCARERIRFATQRQGHRQRRRRHRLDSILFSMRWCGKYQASHCNLGPVVSSRASHLRFSHFPLTLIHGEAIHTHTHTHRKDRWTERSYFSRCTFRCIQAHGEWSAIKTPWITVRNASTSSSSSWFTSSTMPVVSAHVLSSMPPEPNAKDFQRNFNELNRNAICIHVCMACEHRQAELAVSRRVCIISYGYVSYA